MATAEDWQDELRRWLGPFLSHLGHKARRRMCPLYVAGLIGPGERKSVQPMASRTPAADYDQLHHFVGAGIWDEAPLERELLVQADRLVGGADAVLVIDDTALPKKGKHSVGVAPQYATVLGKQANCQTLVSLTLARHEVPVPLALRLYLPEVWTEDPARLAKAGVPEPLRRHRSKSEIALAELDRVLAAGVRFGVVLADAAYGSSSGFRHALSRTRPDVGCRDPSHSEGLLARGRAHLARGAARTSAPEARPRHQASCCARHARPAKMADRHMAARYQRPAQGVVRGGAGSRRGRNPDPRWRTVAPAPPRQRGGLARGRAPFDRRAEVLPIELADRDDAENARGDHQGALALRAGPSAAQGGTWPRSLRRAILERPASPRSHEHGRLPLSAAPATRSGETGKKTGSAHRLSRAYPRYAPPSSRSSTRPLPTMSLQAQELARAARG